MVNASGSVIGRISYDGFGKIVSDTTGGSGDRYKYTGREWDSSVSLQYNRARYYDPAIGKWISRDPIGFDSRDANLYRYVGNGPTNYSDPFGYFSTIGGIAGGITGFFGGLLTTGRNPIGGIIWGIAGAA